MANLNFELKSKESENTLLKDKLENKKNLSQDVKDMTQAMQKQRDELFEANSTIKQNTI